MLEKCTPQYFLLRFWNSPHYKADEVDELEEDDDDSDSVLWCSNGDSTLSSHRFLYTHTNVYYMILLTCVIQEWFLSCIVLM